MTWQTCPSVTRMLQKRPVPRGSASLPGSQIPQRSQEHASEMLLLQLYRNGHTRLMASPRSCTILVRAVVPIAIPPSSLQLCHCSPSLVPMTNNCGVERQASPSLNHHGTMSEVADCEEAASKCATKHPPGTPKKREKGISPGGNHRLAVPWSVPGMGNDLGTSVWMLLDIQMTAPVEGRHCLENGARICS